MVTILIDSREQKPYQFSPHIASARVALPAGDYSIAGQETRFAIERKSLDDWLHTIIHDRKRFVMELCRLSTYQRAFIVVEANWPDILQGKYARANHIAPSSVRGLTLAIMQSYGVPVLMVGDRPSAREIVECLCLEFARYAEQRKELEQEQEQELKQEGDTRAE